MPILKDPPDGENSRNYRQIALLTAVPVFLVVAPAIGFFAGQWADKKLGTDPWMVVVGLVLGFGAAAREIFVLIRKSQALDEKNDDNGT